MIATNRGAGGSAEAFGTLARDPKTGCLIDGKGHPVALPPGTKLEGTGDSVVVVSEDGQRFKLGDEVAGGGSTLPADAIAANYGTVPTECGPAPWLILYEDLGTKS